MTLIKSPLKYQGSKTKLVPWIKDVAQYKDGQRWFEPFMGSGVVGFNINPTNALFADHNPHVIKLFQDLSNVDYFIDHIYASLKHHAKELSRFNVTEQCYDDDYYYDMRSTFNDNPTSQGLLFLNHTCFNGVMRFNRKGNFNVPFGKNFKKLSGKYIDEIIFRLKTLKERIDEHGWLFVQNEFDRIIGLANQESDIIYCDPPYIDRESNYYDSWNAEKEYYLASLLKNSKAKFVLSTWYEVKGEKNPYISKLYGDCNVHTQEHRYNVGQRANNRYPVIEALITNF